MICIKNHVSHHAHTDMEGQPESAGFQFLAFSWPPQYRADTLSHETVIKGSSNANRN